MCIRDRFKLYHLHRLIVPITLAGIELCLDFGNQRGTLFALRVLFLYEGVVRFTSRKNRAELQFGIPFPKGIQTNTLFLIFMSER